MSFPEERGSFAYKLISTIGICMFTFTGIEIPILALWWSSTGLLDLPVAFMYAGSALTSIPALWLTIWATARNWHVETRLERGLDVDEPDFSFGAYWLRSPQASDVESSQP